MPLTTLVAGNVIKAAELDGNYALCVLTDTSRTITVTHTWTASQTMAGLTSSGIITITSASATAFSVGLAGSTNPAFNVDCSTALQVAGLKVTGAVTTGTVAIVVTDSGAVNTNLSINALNAGTIGIGSVSTGRVTITPVTTITGLLTLSAGLTATGELAFTTDLKSTTALATPGALAATQFTAFASTVSGAVLMGFGTTFDATLKNRAGTDVIGVTANTTGVVFAGAVSGITTLAASSTITQSGNGAQIANLGAGTTEKYIHWQNTTGESYIGLNGTNAAALFTGGTANAFQIGSASATAVELGTSDVIRLAISSAGAFDFKGNAVSGVSTLAGTGAVSGFTTYTGSGAILISTNAIYFQGKSSTAVTRDLIGMSAADKVRIDNNGIGVDFGAGATFASGVTVSAGTTAVQALTTAGNITLTTASAPTLTVANSSSNDAYMVLNGGAGTTKNWRFGKDVLTSGAFEIQASTANGGSTYSTSLLTLTSAGVLTVTAGISCTTGTFSTSAKTASGSTSVASGAGGTTIFAISAKGVYVVSGCASDNTAFASVINTADESGNILAIVASGNGGAGSIGQSGNNVVFAQTTGATKTINWRYIRID